MRNLLVLTLLFIFLPDNSFSQDKIAKELSEIKNDTDVLKEGQKAINKRIDDLDQNLNRRIDDLKNIMLCGFGIIFSGMFILMGFIIWDRRTTLTPVVREMEESKQRQKAVEEVLKVYAKKM